MRSATCVTQGAQPAVAPTSGHPETCTPPCSAVLCVSIHFKETSSSVDVKVRFMLVVVLACLRRAWHVRTLGHRHGQTASAVACFRRGSVRQRAHALQRPAGTQRKRAQQANRQLVGAPVVLWLCWFDPSSGRATGHKTYGTVCAKRIRLPEASMHDSVFTAVCTFFFFFWCANAYALSQRWVDGDRDVREGMQMFAE